MARYMLLMAMFCMIAGCSSSNDSSDEVPQDLTQDFVAETSNDLRSLDVTEDTEDPDMLPEDLPLTEPEFLWEGTFVAPPETSDFVQSIPWLSDYSTWSFGLEPGQNDLPNQSLPDLASGNGKVFSLLGYSYPLNTLHSMVGPFYDKGDGFFSDTRVQLRRSGQDSPMGWQRQWSGRVRNGSVVMTQMTNPVASLHTIDFAPLTEDRNSPLMRAFVRVMVVKNHSDSAQEDLLLDVRFERDQIPQETRVLETRDTKSRLATFIGESEDRVTTGTEGLHLALESVPAQSERVVVLAYVLDDANELASETIQALEDSTVDALLEETQAQWALELEPGATINTPDPRVNDYLNGMKIVVMQQQAETGATCPMSQYTRMWLRDTAGPVRFFSRSGYFERVRQMLDYQWLAANLADELKNSTSAIYLFDPEMGPVDWTAKEGMGGRAKAESPSYVPICYNWYWMASGVTDWLEERFEFLHFALRGQQFTEDHLLPFSSDETFRTAMAMAHDYAVDESFEEGFLSVNSSFLWVVGAQFLATFADLLGNSDIAQALLEEAATVRAAADATYLDENGVYRPYYIIEDSALAAKGFEDVNTKPNWTGYLNPLSEKAALHLTGTINELDGGDGVLVSPLPEQYKNYMGLPISEGVHTGMSPGYYLSALATARHPIAEQAFNALAIHATDTGTVPEYQILDSSDPLQLIYDAVGVTGDYTARYRPWEGGISADSVWEYLTGFVPNAPDGAFVLAPQLPNGWSWLEMEGLRIAETRVNARVESRPTDLRINLENFGPDDLTVHLTVPFIPNGEGPTNGALTYTTSLKTSLDGEPVAPTLTTLNWGSHLLSLPAFELASGQTRTVVLSR